MGALRLTVTETVGIFVGIPAAIVLVIVALVFAGRGRGGDRRYRPGRPFDFTPVWFLSTPEHLSESARTALPAGGDVPALTSGEIENLPAPAGVVTGGASDRW